MIKEKECRKCNKPKALVLFYKNSKGKRIATCISCTKVYQADYRRNSIRGFDLSRLKEYNKQVEI